MFSRGSIDIKLILVNYKTEPLEEDPLGLNLKIFVSLGLELGNF